MRMTIATVLVFAVLLPLNVQAEIKGCYERVYDKTYLKKHRKQDVAKIRLQLGVAQGSDGAFELLDRVDAGFRQRAIYDGNLVECKPSGDELVCNIESDGGSFVVTERSEDSVRITNKNFMRFGNSENSVTIKAQGEHREFRLYRVSTSACP